MKPLTCVGLVFRVKNGEDGRDPSVLVASADHQLMAVQPPIDPSDYMAYAEEPADQLKFQAQRVLHLWGIRDARHDLRFGLGQPLSFRRSTYRFWILPLRFLPEPGHTYLTLRLYGTQDRVKLGPFADSASARAWVYTAVSALSAAGAKLPKEGWYGLTSV